MAVSLNLNPKAARRVRSLARRILPGWLHAWGNGVVAANRRRHLRKVSPVTYYGQQVELNPDDLVISWTLAKEGQFEPGLVKVCIDHLERGGVAIDVGANLGLFTIPMAKKIGARGKVLAIEPEPENFRFLRANTRGFAQVVPIGCAIGGVNGQMVLFRSRSNKGLHSLGRDAVRDEQGSVEVRVRTLDELIKDYDVKRVDLLKLDIQGAEPLAIQGANEVLTRFRPAILFEYFEPFSKACGANPTGMISGLERLGYEFHEVDCMSGRMTHISADEVLGRGAMAELNVMAISTKQGTAVQGARRD